MATHKNKTRRALYRSRRSLKSQFRLQPISHVPNLRRSCLSFVARSVWSSVGTERCGRSGVWMWWRSGELEQAWGYRSPWLWRDNSHKSRDKRKLMQLTTYLIWDLIWILVSMARVRNPHGRRRRRLGEMGRYNTMINTALLTVVLRFRPTVLSFF